MGMVCSTTLAVRVCVYSDLSPELFFEGFSSSNVAVTCTYAAANYGKNPVITMGIFKRAGRP